MTDPKSFLAKLQKNLNTLKVREAKYAGTAPLDLLNQITDHETAIELTKQRATGQLNETEWQDALKPLLVSLEKAQIIIDQQEQQVDTQYNVIGDLIIYNYPPPPAPTVIEKDISDDETTPDNPYRGLFAFRPEHAHLFFGRETFTQKLVQATESRSLVAVLGASGSGKSSVVFAGLVPALLNKSDDAWLFTTFRPGDDPFLGLAGALVPLIEPEMSRIKQVGEARDVATRLREGHSPLTDYVKQIHHTHPDSRLLIIADQFEELYTLCQDDNVRQKFLDVLLDTVVGVQRSSPRLIFTLRADFLGQALTYRPLTDVLQDADLKLGAMTRKEMTEAIEKPAELQGVHFEEKLVARLLDDVAGEEGGLPLLEFSLTELWRHQRQRTLTHVAYEEIGEIKGALGRHADNAYQRLSPVEQEQARRIFVKLVNPGLGTMDTRRLVARSELEAYWPLVVKLADERLVVTNTDKNEQETVEIVHEALIREWRQLWEWLEEDRTTLRIHHRLTEASNEWQQSNRDKSYLYQGLRLAEVEDWQETRKDDLSTLEHEFLDESLWLRDKRYHEQLRNKVRAIAGNGALAGFIGGLVGGAIQNLIISLTERDPEGTRFSGQPGCDDLLIRGLVWLGDRSWHWRRLGA